MSSTSTTFEVAILINYTCSDKSNSTTFQVVHRAQNDPKINDEDSGSAVFREVPATQSHKIKSRHDLELELFDDASAPALVRYNEGEAAEHGIYYDDTVYDYMQHVRDIGSSSESGQSHFVDSTAFNKNKTAKHNVSLEEALRGSSLRDTRSDAGTSKIEALLGDDATASKELRPMSYQDQQDIPDALAGFQPDMDPRLREVLEALDDDAYVDDEEDMFKQIAKDGDELTSDEFEQNPYDEADEEDGWESDATERPHPSDTVMTQGNADASSSESMDTMDQEWMKEFRKFKQDQKSLNMSHPQTTPADVQSSVLTGASGLTEGRRKKRKGALTSSTAYSMTSSSLARTEGERTLDARFERLEELYGGNDEMDLDEDDSTSLFSKNSVDSEASRLSRMSNASRSSFTLDRGPSLASSGVEEIMDEFLGTGPQRRKPKEKQAGKRALTELDEIRRDLGPARLRVQKAN